VKDPSSHRYAAIYARVSTEDQGKGFSTPTQLEACQKLAEREGYAVPESHVLVDEGLSGTTMDRPGLRKLRDLVNSKRSRRQSCTIPIASRATWAINCC